MEWIPPYITEPKCWKSLVTGNEFDYETHANIEEQRGIKKPLPKDEYPYTIIYKEPEKPLWMQ